MYFQSRSSYSESISNSIPLGWARMFISTHLPPVDELNAGIESAVTEQEHCRPIFPLFNKGCDDNEKSCVFIEEDDFYWMG